MPFSTWGWLQVEIFLHRGIHFQLLLGKEIFLHQRLTLHKTNRSQFASEKKGGWKTIVSFEGLHVFSIRVAFIGFVPAKWWFILYAFFFASRDFVETHPGTLNHQGTMVDFLWLLGWSIIPGARLFWLSSIEIAPRLKGLKVHVFLGSRKRTIYKRPGEFCERLPFQKPGLNSVWTM